MPSFFFFFAGLEAGRPAFHDEGRDALFTFCRVRVHVDDGRVGHAAGRNPGLGAVDDVTVAFADSPGGKRGGVRARLRLGQPIATDLFAAGEGSQETLLLLFASEAVDGPAIEGVLDGEDHAGGSADAGKLLDHDGVTCMVEPRPAIGFGNGDTGETERGGLAEIFTWELSGFVDLARAGANFGFCEFAHGLAEQLLVVGEVEVHGGFSRRRESGIVGRSTELEKEKGKRKSVGQASSPVRTADQSEVKNVDRQECLSYVARAARSFSKVTARSSGWTRDSAMDDMKLVSPAHRGRTWRCRWPVTPAPAARPRFMPRL